jgi:4'-phosphopantetheinyl transferase
MSVVSIDEVHVFQADISPEGLVDLDLCWKLLGEVERTRAERFRYDLHRDRYVRAHGQLQIVLADYLNMGGGRVAIETKAGGKPFIPGHDIQFNMSHSADVAVNAITMVDAIGIDVELFDRRVEVDDLSAHYYTQAEQNLLSGLSTEERHQAFFWLWTAKEARMKLTGEGLALDPRNIDVGFQANRPATYKLPLAPLAHPLPVQFDNFEGACTVAGFSKLNPVVRSMEDLLLRS